MEKSLGKIIKLNRQLLKIKQEYICSVTGLSKSYYSRMERNKENISEKIAKNIFQSMGIKVLENDITEIFEKDFYAFYLDIAYDNDCTDSYQKVMSYTHGIQSTSSYVKYLLVQMIFHVLNDENCHIKDYMYLEDYLEYLETYQMQLYYDYIGVWLYHLGQFSESNRYFEIAETYKGNIISESMLYYHTSINLRQMGNLTLSNEYNMKAIDYFSQSLNIIRLICSKIQQTNIEIERRNYEIAEKMSYQCIDALKRVNLNNRILIVYNNLLWMYIHWEKYEKIIMAEKELVQNSIQDHCIYFYLSYAYEKIGKHDEAKKYIKLAKKYLNNPTLYMKTMIQTYSVYLSNASIDKKEKYLLKVYQVAKESHNKDLKIFTLSILTDFYKEHDMIEKLAMYQEKLLKSYKQVY